MELAHRRINNSAHRLPHEGKNKKRPQNQTNSTNQHPACKHNKILVLQPMQHSCTTRTVPHTNLSLQYNLLCSRGIDFIAWL